MSTASHRSNGIYLRGRLFTGHELVLINEKVNKHYDEGRTAISIKICEELGWRQPNGWLKDRACRDVLQKLSERGLIDLPVSRKKPRVDGKLLKPIKTPVEEVEITVSPRTLTFELAKGDKNELLWNKLVDYYHYLGHRVTVGKSLKYLIYGDGQLIGCIGFSSPANMLRQRDSFLKEHCNLSLRDIHKYCINNSRFLILPFVRVKNLATRILSEASKKIITDWNSYYSVRPLLIETFVQISRFKGTCYKAANWCEVGVTKGYSKKGANYIANKEPKVIFLYSLDKNTRKKIALKGAL